MTGPFADLAHRVRFRTPTAYAVDGELVEARSPAPAPPGAGEGYSDGIPAIVRQLQHHLYERCYLERTSSLTAAPAMPAAGTWSDETPALAAANVHADRWDPAWTISRINAEGSVLVRRQGRARVVWGGEYHSTLIGTPPFVGATVRVFVPHEAPALQPGYYFAFGDVLGDQLEELGMVRLYWNVPADEAPWLLHELVTALRRYHVPFRLKALAVREFYPRPDALVLYVTQRYVPVTFRLARRIHDASGSRLGERAPLFSRALARGLGLAEDPGNGESFGMSRCRVAAEGLWNAFVTGAADDSAVQEVLAGYVRRAGLDPVRPWINPGSTDQYDWEAAA